MAYYVFDGANNKYDSMTKEQILSAITSAIETHSISNVDTGFVTTLKEQNNQTGLKFWVGTQAEYNALVAQSALQENTFYIIGDDSTVDDLQAAIAELQTSFSEIESTITTMQGDISDNASAISTLDGEVTALQNATVPVNKGGTGATTAANARTNLGINLQNLGIRYTDWEVEFPANATRFETTIPAQGFDAETAGHPVSLAWVQVVGGYNGTGTDLAELCIATVPMDTGVDEIPVVITFGGSSTHAAFYLGLNAIYTVH